ncbi:hypothetical protein GGR53DRAFT_112350 [Hypoxylon sp. FL1150]|nr:hypothetical protein GGR53DRAFT_112350 [Hypoxylon sp. FL1150]
MSTSRVFVSSFRAVGRRAATPKSTMRWTATRKGYSTKGHDGRADTDRLRGPDDSADRGKLRSHYDRREDPDKLKGHNGRGRLVKRSDMPWLIASVGITVPAVAWLLASSPRKPAHARHHHNSASPPESRDGRRLFSKPPEPPPDDDGPPVNRLPINGNPKAAHRSSETGRQVPPLPADNTDLATNWEEKRKRHEEYKDLCRQKDTKAASHSNAVPSKRIAAEHPREDPKRGKGAAIDIEEEGADIKIK